MKLRFVGSVLAGLFLHVSAQGAGDSRPEDLGAHWARIPDRAQIELAVDELRSAEVGTAAARIAGIRIAGGREVSEFLRRSASAVPDALKRSITIGTSTANVQLATGDQLRFEKSGNTWRLTAGSVPQGNAATSMNSMVTMGAPSLPSVGETFIATPVSREHSIDRLSRGVTESRIGRRLFGIAEKTASYYFAHYMQTAPFVSATYIQFVTDPEWNRLLYGNLNYWIKAYEVKGPSAVAIDADGRVFVGEVGHERVTVLRIVGTGNEAQVQPQFVIANIATPTDLALSDNGTPLNTGDDMLYVADASESKVSKYQLSSGSASAVAVYEGFDSPSSIMVGKWNGASTALVYVVDKIGKRLRVFEDRGSSLSLIREIQGGHSQYFSSMKSDHFGNVYVVDNVNSRVLKFTASLDLLDSQGGEDVFAALGNMDIPFGKIVIDGDGTYWAGFDQMFALERWANESGAQRRTFGLRIKDIDFRTDDDISSIGNAFTLTDFGQVDIRIFDNRNRVVRTVNASWLTSGAKNFVWNRRGEDGAQVPAGEYRYEIAAKSAYRDQSTVSNTAFYLPMYYWENSGSESAVDDQHLIQGSAVRWGTGPSETVNEHPSAVQYRFSGLNPSSEYFVAVEYVAQDGNRHLQDLTAGSTRLHEPVPVGSSPQRMGWMALPRESYSGGEVVISINARGEGFASVSQLWFKETGAGFNPRQVGASIPTFYTLEQNYPNPFNPSTIIRYAIPTAGEVELKVFDIAGREFATLVNEFKPAGRYEVRFDAVAASSGRSMASGVYFYRVRSGEFLETKKMLLLK
jgi:hypothetical protein